MTLHIRQLNSRGQLSGTQKLPERWKAVIRREGDYIEGFQCKLCN